MSSCKFFGGAEPPMTIGDDLKQLPENRRTRNTVASLLVRLVGKNVVAYDKEGKKRWYDPVLQKEAYNVSAAKFFLSKMFGDSVPPRLDAVGVNGLWQSPLPEFVKISPDTFGNPLPIDPFPLEPY